MYPTIAPSFCCRKVNVGGNVVAFTGIPVGSDLDSRIESLDVLTRKFDGLLGDGLSSDSLKIAAREVVVAFERMIESISFMSADCSHQMAWIKAAMGVAGMVMEVFAADQVKFDGNGVRDELGDKARVFFESTVGRRLTKDLWDELKFYEWALSKQLVRVGRYSYALDERESLFSAEELDQYYAANESDIFQRMLRSQQCPSINNRVLLDLPDPLNDPEIRDLVAAFKLAPGGTKKLE
ncbi:hypothetical protein PQR34_30310 [Paraburkholderia sediminicola]|uniref:hypothetical protein n=1 Tax=Paraburkholderia sediminicola TaxID=458836 RepID=UPI0038BCCDD8